MLHDDFHFEPAEATKVSNNDWDSQYLATKFGCSPDHLLRAMRATGASAEEVKQYLRS
ncbi:MAG: DUF3606 domain-containing protein [Oxalicibacterium faecigallinarum]|uniref:DUF3606 domain-containing protein n=1 Tax=Oxalicibacterium faecigallinarum TaxID=573741 RepID=A0A8J3F6R0_9BURK|nr:DUF3606 domain-containing protein [Oxalicibacterium faecigallinarum]MDQ7969111.1 DUF3606 domain-containing protein [Oxalicibacterium faecigallinarum]GGI19724.1 hypothetical protein GCM10008066_20460 [Oxalicibacterium faecigallinarum]